MHISKRVLVTGGAGFIGSFLCEQLLSSGAEVLCVDNFFTGSRANVAHLLGNPKFEVMRHDVTFPLYVEVDEIYNMACPASPVHYQFDPVQTTKTSVHGAINMLGLAKRVRAKILQASTSEVYGDPVEHPQTEGYWGNVNPIGPRSCYGDSTKQELRSREFSTPTVPACIPTMAALYQTSLFKRFEAKTSRSMVTANRHVHFAMSMTWFAA
jgi:UDP-glucuronate decarboxylase